ncbi:lipoate--protein ligase [Halobacteriales archaeon QS_3_64_16]|nr:MAG: lipoate--protein ligase [Halobacteriales archaeon QS_3_64_16]
MRVLRGRAGDIETDRRRTRKLVERVGEADEPALRVWTPHRQIAFGRRDTREEGYERAREAAEAAGFPAIERRVGGRAVAYTGSTVAFARTEPVSDIRSGLTDRYEAATTDLQVALHRLGVRSQPGEPPDSFCPGTHSLQTTGEEGGKIAGVAQRIGRGAALVAGVVIIDSSAEIVAVLETVYDALEVPFDPATIGSIERAGGETGREEVLAEIERALVGDASDVDVERIAEE